MKVPNDGDLLDQIKNALMECGCDESSVDVLLESVLVAGDDGDDRSILVSIKFTPFHCDDGRIVPKPISLQFDLQGGEWVMIAGEDTATPICMGTLFAALYFNSLQVEGGESDGQG